MSEPTPLLWDEPAFDAGPSSTGPRGTLEARLGAPREAWAAEDLVRFCRHHDVRLVSLMHVSADGSLKALDFVPRSDEHLLDILTGGERADGSSLFAGVGIPTDASDIVLRPRPSSAFLHPFEERPTLVVLCGHADRGGNPLAVSPDTVAWRAWARLREETGLQLWALGEVELYLGRRASEGEAERADDRGYHATAPQVFGEGLRRRALFHLSEMGVPVKYAHGEVGSIGPADGGGTAWEQHEIELDLLPLPEAADAIVLVRWVLRSLARQEGLLISMAPVVAPGHAGNGLHLHLAPRERGVDRAGRNAQGRLTDASRWLLGGLVGMGDALMAFSNRVPESFVRLAGGRETPRALTWGEFDRSALVRIPAIPRAADGRPVAAPTIELRLPDGSAHPHLALAGAAQAMRWARRWDDLDARLERTSSRATPDRRDAAVVPRSFAEVGAALRRTRDAFEAGGVFPPALIDAYLERLEANRAPGA